MDVPCENKDVGFRLRRIHIESGRTSWWLATFIWPVREFCIELEMQIAHDGDLHRSGPPAPKEWERRERRSPNVADIRDNLIQPFASHSVGQASEPASGQEKDMGLLPHHMQ